MLQILSTDKDSSQFYLSEGMHTFIMMPRGNVIQIDTPDASTRAFDRAIFRIDMSDQYQYTDMAVYKGYVETENEVGKTRINAGQMVPRSARTQTRRSHRCLSDEWARWNKMRNDKIFARRTGVLLSACRTQTYSSIWTTTADGCKSLSMVMSGRRRSLSV
jgi:hypothetical protein